MKNRTLFCRIFAVAVMLVFIAFIFSNSAKDAVTSEASSDKFTGAAQKVADFVTGGRVTVSALFIRKSAHFCEFALLGVLTSLTFLTFGAGRFRFFPAIQLICTLTAMTDETIQLFSEGRSCEVADVWLDSCGAATGIAICLFIIFLVTRKKKKFAPTGEETC